MKIGRFELAAGRINRLKFVLTAEVTGEDGGGAGELVAAALKIIFTTKNVLFFGVELTSAVGLVKPDYADGAGVIVDLGFGDTEVAAVSAASGEVLDFALDDDFAGAEVGNFAGDLEVFVVAREVINEVAQRENAGFVQLLGGLRPDTFDGGYLLG